MRLKAEMAGFVFAFLFGDDANPVAPAVALSKKLTTSACRFSGYYLYYKTSTKHAGVRPAGRRTALSWLNEIHMKQRPELSADTTPDDVSRDVERTFARAEQNGIKLAIVGRTVALVLLGIWIVATRADDPARLSAYLIALTVFVALGLFQYSLIATRFDRIWVKYIFITIDIAIISALVATRPMYESAAGLPAAMIFRLPIFPFYFVILGIAAFSFSPGLVLWSGIAAALGWLGAFFSVTHGLDGIRTWNDIPPSPTADEVMAVVLDPNFAGFEARIQEAISLVVVAFLIASVMWRARKTLRMQLAAERDRATISGIFGQFVPQSIVDAMVKNRGALAPVEREATILFADIAGFTTMTERLGPARMVQALNVYFDEMAQIIGERHGVVTQFQGDAVLATFNVPIENADHAENAFEAARSMLDIVSKRDFAGERLKIRIGINTGTVVAGNVGGGGRQSYTVNGDTVNLAARLETLCKEHNTALLLSAATASAISADNLVAVGNISVRGLSHDVAVYTIPTAHHQK